MREKREKRERVAKWERGKGGERRGETARKCFSLSRVSRPFLSSPSLSFARPSLVRCNGRSGGREEERRRETMRGEVVEEGLFGCCPWLQKVRKRSAKEREGERRGVSGRGRGGCEKVTRQRDEFKNKRRRN